MVRQYDIMRAMPGIKSQQKTDVLASGGRKLMGILQKVKEQERRQQKMQKSLNNF